MPILVCPTCGSAYGGIERYCMRDGVALVTPNANDMKETRPLRNLPEAAKTTARLATDEAETRPVERLTTGEVLCPEGIAVHEEATALIGKVSDGGGRAEYLRRQLNQEWLDLQESWLRISSQLLASPCPDPDTLAREQAELTLLLDEFRETATELRTLLRR